MSEKVLIMGLSKSGVAAARFLNKKGYDVYITESKSLADIREEFKPQVQELKDSKGLCRLS